MTVDDSTGDLLIGTRVGQLRQHKPFVYQEMNGARHQVESRYQIKGAACVGFALGAYDRSKPLVIDPVLAYSTFLGGSGSDVGNGIAVDSAGNAYVTGETASANFPTANPIDDSANGNSDVFITKLNASGSALVYSTYLGGSGNDSGLGIALDSQANAYVSGFTASTNFPTASAIDESLGGLNDVFVTKLNAAGSALVYSTYLGGSVNDFGRGIAVDSAGNSYVTGNTLSSDFPTANAIQSVFGGAAGNGDAATSRSSTPAGRRCPLISSAAAPSRLANGIAVDSEEERLRHRRNSINQLPDGQMPFNPYSEASTSAAAATSS